MQSLMQWLGQPSIEWDFQNLTVRPHESDSYYRFKYPHQTYSTLREPEQHLIPARIQAELQRQFSWFYQIFYPGLLEGNES
jgi:sulfotransferase